MDNENRNFIRQFLSDYKIDARLNEFGVPICRRGNEDINIPGKPGKILSVKIARKIYKDSGRSIFIDHREVKSILMDFATNGLGENEEEEFLV